MNELKVRILFFCNGLLTLLILELHDFRRRIDKRLMELDGEQPKKRKRQPVEQEDKDSNLISDKQKTKGISKSRLKAYGLE